MRKEFEILSCINHFIILVFSELFFICLSLEKVDKNTFGIHEGDQEKVAQQL